jgi:mannosyltransferase
VRRDPTLLLLAILLVAATLLRLHRLGDEAWFDEILTQIRVSRLGLWQIATTYESQNQHLLYSLLARLSIDVFGDTVAALRAPAAICGVLSVGATFLIGRELLSRREALVGAALLAFSDLHVWFSQNARGYTALSLATLVSSWLLLRALASDRRRSWLGYGVVVALGLWVHLTMLFVLVGHGLLVLHHRIPGAADADARRERLREPLIGFAFAALLVALLYAPIVGDLLTVTATEGRDGAIPEWSSSSWALQEAVARVLESFPRPGLALGALVCGIAGLWSVWRRRPVLLELLLLPIVVGLVVVLGSGHHVWPRFFFFASGFLALIVAAGAVALGESMARRLTADPRRIALGGNVAGLLLVVAVALGLPGAYGPKQRFAETAALLDRLVRPGDAVVMVGPAARVLEDAFGRGWPRVRTAAELTAARNGARRTYLVHAFPPHLRGRYPEVARMLEQDFVLVAQLDGTLRGGEILVWRTRERGEGFAPPPS